MLNKATVVFVFLFCLPACLQFKLTVSHALRFWENFMSFVKQAGKRIDVPSLSFSNSKWKRNATESIFHSFAQTARFENILGIILEIRCKLIHFTLFTAVNKVTGRILLDVRLLMNASKCSCVPVR